MKTNKSMIVITAIGLSVISFAKEEVKIHYTSPIKPQRAVQSPPQGQGVKENHGADPIETYTKSLESALFKSVLKALEGVTKDDLGQSPVDYAREMAKLIGNYFMKNDIESIKKLSNLLDRVNEKKNATGNSSDSQTIESIKDGLDSSDSQTIESIKDGLDHQIEAVKEKLKSLGLKSMKGNLSTLIQEADEKGIISEKSFTEMLEDLKNPSEKSPSDPKSGGLITGLLKVLRSNF